MFRLPSLSWQCLLEARRVDLAAYLEEEQALRPRGLSGLLISLPARSFGITRMPTRIIRFFHKPKAWK